MFTPDQLELAVIVNTSNYKTGASVSFGEYESKPVVVKQGGDELLREAGILAGIDHPCFPSVIESTSIGGCNVLVLEHLDGAPLDTLIGLDLGEDHIWQSEPVEMESASQIVDGLAACYEALKEAGYYYRDLNLNHVLVSNERVSLVDVEWSVPINSGGKATVDSHAGTWVTMSPEEFQVGNFMSEASSVYTLGTALAQLLTGNNPFAVLRDTVPDDELRRHATYLRHIELPIILLGDEKAEAFLTRCLQPDPSNRFQTIEEFRRELTLIIP